MKKLAAAIICLLLTLTLAISCGGGEKNANPTGPEKTGTGDGRISGEEENGEQAGKGTPVKPIENGGNFEQN